MTNSEHPYALGLGGRDGDISLPVYLIVPVDPAEVRIEIETKDTADVLKAVESLLGDEAEVLADGRQAFFFRVDPKALWAIFRRDPDGGVTSRELG